MKEVFPHLKIGKIDFNCPYCEKEYSDIDDKYLSKCNKNKSFMTKVKCSCSNVFSMTYNYMGNVVSFKNK